MIREWWNEPQLEGCGVFTVSKELACLIKPLKCWAKHTFGAIKAQKVAILELLDLLDVTKENRNLNPNEQIQELDHNQSLVTILQQEETYWKQRSLITWLKVGDANTKYFHDIANGRRNQNHIQAIKFENTMYRGDNEIGQAFTSLFRSQFGSKHQQRFKIN